jgi:ferredoxin-nitrite reductase
VDTVRDAEALSARLTSERSTGSPVNIHFTGCAKCCAQRRPASLTLLGRPGTGDRYDLYVGGGGDPRLGRLIQEDLAPEDALTTVEGLVVTFEEEKRAGRAELARRPAAGQSYEPSSG